MANPDCYEEIGLIYYANFIVDTKLEKLTIQEAYLNAAEDFLQHCFEGCQPQLKTPVVFRAMDRFAAQCGRPVYKGGGKEVQSEQKLGERVEKFAAAEAELWQEVGKYNIGCEPCLQETRGIASLVRKKEGCQPDTKAVVGPPLKFDDSGMLEEDLTYKAAKDGIQVGVAVVVRKRCPKAAYRRELHVGETGIVIEVTPSHVQVVFGRDDEQPCPRSALDSKPADGAAESSMKKQKVDNCQSRTHQGSHKLVGFRVSRS